MQFVRHGAQLLLFLILVVNALANNFIDFSNSYKIGESIGAIVGAFLAVWVLTKLYDMRPKPKKKK